MVKKIELPPPDVFSKRSGLTSKKMNETYNQLRNAVLRTMLRAQRTRQQVQEIAIAQLYASQLQVIQQEAIRKDIEAARNAGVGKVIAVNFYRPPDSNVMPDTGIKRDLLFGQISLAEAGHFSKITVYTDDYGDIRTSDNVTAYQDGVALEHTNPFYWTFTRQNDRFWLDNTANINQSTVIRIVTPRGVRNTVNNVSVTPFPYGSCRITAVEYLGASSYVTAPGFEETDRPVSYHFGPSTYNGEVRITLRANAVANSGEVQGLWGLSDIDIAYVDYVSTGTAYARVKAKGTDTITKIIAFSANAYIDTNMPLTGYSAQPVRFKLLKLDGSVIYDSLTQPYPLLKTNSAISVSGSPTELILQVDLREPIDGITPVVKDVTISYE